MGSTLLKDILLTWHTYPLDDDIYVPIDLECDIDTPVVVLPFDRTRPRILNNMEYLLSFEQVRDVILGLEQQLGRSSSPEERLAAVVHYARHDAFIDPSKLR
jgi:hypothetical protein